MPYHRCRARVGSWLRDSVDKHRAGDVEVSSGRRFHVKRLGRNAVEALSCIRLQGTGRERALPLLFSLLVEDDNGRPLLGAAFVALPIEDRRLLLTALIERNRSIFGIPTAGHATDLLRLRSATAAELDDIAWTFINNYLNVDDILVSEMIVAMRSSSA